jgi:hypothetical protein
VHARLVIHVFTWMRFTHATSWAFSLTGIDEGNLEIRVHRLSSVSKKYCPLPYPVRLPGRRRNPAVDKQRGSVEALVSFSVHL